MYQTSWGAHEAFQQGIRVMESYRCIRGAHSTGLRGSIEREPGGGWERPRRAHGIRALCRRGAQAGFWKTVLAANGKHPENPALSIPITPSRVVSLCFLRTGATLILCSQDSQVQPTSARMCPMADADICRAE